MQVAILGRRDFAAEWRGFEEGVSVQAKRTQSRVVAAWVGATGCARLDIAPTSAAFCLLATLARFRQRGRS